MEGLLNKKYRKYYLTIIFAVVLVLLPTHPAKACVLGWDPISACILEGTSYFIFLIFTVVGKGIAALAGTLQWVINLPVYPADGQRIAVIDESWKIMRNFANMFFIVALIMMAFATIFDVLPGAAKYNARALFGRFLLTALLINFSLVIGVMVIQGTQVLNNTFLTSIGDMSGRLGQGLNPSNLLPNVSATTASQAVDQGIFGALVALIFALVLAATFLFSILTAVIFAFVRIPIIWALLVVSPIAWILNIFPAGQGTFKKWWSLFIGWNMFLPIFLFFLYFGLYFLQGQDAVVKAIAGSSSTGNILGDVTTSFTFQMLFMYVMAGIFLIGGTIVAMKASMFSGTGVVGIATWSRGVAARRLGLTAAGGAAKQRFEQVQKEGLPTRFGQAIFGGQRALELETARRARQFGVKGAIEKGVEIEKEKQKPFANNVERLRDLASTGSREQRLAARARLMELGDKKFLNVANIEETHRMAGGDRSELATKILSSVDATKLENADERRKFSELSAVRNNVEIFKKAAIARAEKDKLSETEMEALARQMINDADVKEFLDKGVKKNIVAVAKTRIAMQVEGARELDKELEKAFKKMSDDQVLEMMNDPGFNDLIRDPEVRHAMNNTLGKNPKRLANLATKSSGATQARLERLAGAARKIQNRPKIEALRRKEQNLIPQINQARTDISTIEADITALQNNPVLLNQPTSATAAQLRQQISQLEKQQATKESEVKSLSDKRDKINERIESIRTGEPSGTPTP